MSDVEVRAFSERDRDELRQLFGHAGEGAPSSSLWGHEESEADVYLTPYMDLAPGSLLVAVKDGALVGYLTGCPDSSQIPSESERISRAMRRHRLLCRPKPARFLLRAVLDVTIAVARLLRHPTAADFSDPRWPAHLHLNVVPDVRGTGVAGTLMARWLDQLTRSASPGSHLQTLIENTRAVRFFERSGFSKQGPNPIVPGIRDRGRRLHQQTMVWSPQHADSTTTEAWSETGSLPPDSRSAE